VKSKLKIVLLIALLVFAADHITKWLIVDSIALGGKVTLIPNLFDLVHGRNSGAAFGFLSGWDSPLKDWFFYSVGLVALIFLYYYVKAVNVSDRVTLVTLGMILGGASGNIVDRIIRGNVVDFLSVHYYHKLCSFKLLGYQFTFPLDWPAFNVADSAITVAVCLLLIQQLRIMKNDKKAPLIDK